MKDKDIKEYHKLIKKLEESNRTKERSYKLYIKRIAKIKMSRQNM